MPLRPPPPPRRAGRRGPATWVPPGRALHLHDVENMAGCARPTRSLLRTVRAQVDQVAPPRHGDHVIAGSNPCVVPWAAPVWSAGQWVGRHGADGADHALLAMADPEDVAARYARLVIGSGDHAFTDLALAARLLGVEVWVLARPGSLARGLEAAAHRVCLLPDGLGLVDGWAA